MKHSRGKETGVDVGCGEMGNYSLFQTQRYIGIDLDKNRLETGQKKYPETETICARMEEIGNVKGDFILCVQVFNNVHFDTKKTIEMVDLLCSMLNKGGSLIFNIGSDSKNCEQAIDTLLSSKIKSIKKIRYGSSFATQQRPSIVSLIFAKAMFYFPVLRDMGGYHKIYYYCSNKAD